MILSTTKTELQQYLAYCKDVKQTPRATIVRTLKEREKRNSAFIAKTKPSEDAEARIVDAYCRLDAEGKLDIWDYANFLVWLPDIKETAATAGR